MKPNEFIDKIEVPKPIEELLKSCSSLTVGSNEEQLKELAVRDEKNGIHSVGYEVNGKIKEEAHVCRVKNGISVNYLEAYMRRRDPDSMLIADDLPTEKAQYKGDFSILRQETMDWLKEQDLAVFLFKAGQLDIDMYGLAIAPANAGFFCLGLSLLQGIIDPESLSSKVKIKTVIYVAPPFRHTHFDGKQRVVHHRSNDLHEIFSYNLYPGPSAKKGVYSALIDAGEQEGWITAHASVVQVVTPYDHRINIMHEGASGGGKSEMHEHVHREMDGSILFARHTLTDERVTLTLPKTCDLKPVADDMAICHSSLQKTQGGLTVQDAEAGWFIRVDHIKNYGTDPDIEALSIHPKEPLLFLNLDASPKSTALLWDHTEDEPGKACPNPRFIVPRRIVPAVINKPVNVHLRTFGVRTPPCTKEDPSYGIIGLFHVLPPALAWLWRLVSPRGFANPSIVDSGGMSSEGVGSYWPFATGRRTPQANLLLEQIINSPQVHYALCPNQHIGAYKVSFNPQWVMREYMARRGGVRFLEKHLSEARCPLLGFTLNKLIIEGQKLETGFLKVERQVDVGTEAYDAGATILTDFFKRELEHYHKDTELDPRGKKIIECFFSNGSVKDYMGLVDEESIFIEE